MTKSGKGIVLTLLIDIRDQSEEKIAFKTR